MRELERKQKTKRIIYSTPTLLLLVVLVIILVRSAFFAVQKERESVLKVRELEEKADILFLRGEELEKNIAYIGTEEGIKEELKAKFNVSEGGESFVVIIDSQEKNVSSSTTDTFWYKKWWNALKNLSFLR